MNLVIGFDLGKHAACADILADADLDCWGQVIPVAEPLADTGEAVFELLDHLANIANIQLYLFNALREAA